MHHNVNWTRLLSDTVIVDSLSSSTLLGEQLIGCVSFNLCPSAGHHPEPPRADLPGLRPRAGLPHLSHCLQVQRAQGEDRPSIRQEAWGQPQGSEVWRRRHHHHGAWKTHVCWELLPVPASGWVTYCIISWIYTWLSMQTLWRHCSCLRQWRLHPDVKDLQNGSHLLQQYKTSLWDKV